MSRGVHTHTRNASSPPSSPHPHVPHPLFPHFTPPRLPCHLGTLQVPLVLASRCCRCEVNTSKRPLSSLPSPVIMSDSVSAAASQSSPPPADTQAADVTSAVDDTPTTTSTPPAGSVAAGATAEESKAGDGSDNESTLLRTTLSSAAAAVDKVVGAVSSFDERYGAGKARVWLAGAISVVTAATNNVRVLVTWRALCCQAKRLTSVFLCSSKHKPPNCKPRAPSLVFQSRRPLRRCLRSAQV